MPAVRDPLSVTYDAMVRRVLLAAMREGTRVVNGRRRPRIAAVFVESRPAAFRSLDKGGRTKYERAFTRSVYYQLYKVPINQGMDPDWSPRLDWGKIERRGTRWGRVVKVRLFMYGVRSARAAQKRGTWITDEGLGTWAAGTRRSLPGARIDD